jgi:hypothetical protein
VIITYFFQHIQTDSRPTGSTEERSGRRSMKLATHLDLHSAKVKNVRGSIATSPIHLNSELRHPHTYQFIGAWAQGRFHLHSQQRKQIKQCCVVQLALLSIFRLRRPLKDSYSSRTVPLRVKSGQWTNTSSTTLLSATGQHHFSGVTPLAQKKSIIHRIGGWMAPQLFCY